MYVYQDNRMIKMTTPIYDWKTGKLLGRRIIRGESQRPADECDHYVIINKERIRVMYAMGENIAYKMEE